MNELLRCAKNFQLLTNISYTIILGKKGKTKTIHLCFNSTEFHHLLGLHKLVDMRISRDNRKKVFEDILNEKITIEHIQNSKYFNQVQERIYFLTHLEKIIDSNKLIFRYNKSLNAHSKIKATYLFSTEFSNTEIYAFIDTHAHTEESHFCRSFFPKGTVDFTRGQLRYTLLFKEKANSVTGVKGVQYNILK